MANEVDTPNWKRTAHFSRQLPFKSTSVIIQAERYEWKPGEAGEIPLACVDLTENGEKPDRSSSWLLDYERRMSDTTSECYAGPKLNGYFILRASLSSLPRRLNLENGAGSL